MPLLSTSPSLMQINGVGVGEGISGVAVAVGVGDGFSHAPDMA